MGVIAEKDLLKIATGTAILGIVAISLLIYFYAPKEEQGAKQVFTEPKGETVYVKGIVKTSQSSANFTRITLITEIPVILFSNITISKDAEVFIEGKVSDYKDKREIIAEKVSYTG